MEIYIQYIRVYFLHLSNITIEPHYCGKVYVFQSKELKKANDEITDLTHLIH